MNLSSDAMDGKAKQARARAVALFDKAQEHSRQGEYEQAAASFEAAEVAIRDYPPGMLWEVAFRIRRGAALMNAQQLEASLAVLDKVTVVLAELERTGLSTSLKAQFPDEPATAYMLRALVLEQLGRLADARDAIPAVLEETGTGSTPNQRRIVSAAYRLQARAAIDAGDYQTAVRAISSALDHAARFTEPWVDDERQESIELRQTLERLQASQPRISR